MAPIDPSQTPNLVQINSTSSDTPERLHEITCVEGSRVSNIPNNLSYPGIDVHFDDRVYQFNSNKLVNPLINCSKNTSNISDYDDYFYDYSDADPSLPLDEVLPVSLLYGITLVVGVVGNLLVIAAVARDRRLRSITNIFLTSLATADLALLCFCVPVKCVAFFSFTWAFGFFLCKAVNYLQTVTMVCSVMTLTVMSIERNIAILSPLRSKSICTRGRARVVILLLWIGSFILAMPILLGQKHKPVGAIIKAFWCLKEWDHFFHGVLYESYMLVLLFLVPVGVMIVSYTTICLELSKGTQFRRQAMGESGPRYHGHINGPRGYRSSQQALRSSKSDASALYSKHKERMDHEKLKVIRMLIVVVVLFAVCWGPILINNLLISVGVLSKLHFGKLKPFRQTIFLMSYLNSSVNPLVYGFMSRHFRRGFREAICVCCSRSGRRRQSRFGMWRGKNKSFFSSEAQTSIVRTGTIRMSPVSQLPEHKNEKFLETLSGSVRFKNYPQCRKIWARRCDSTSMADGIEEI